MVHGRRHTWEYGKQAKLFNASASHWLESSSDPFLLRNANGSEIVRKSLSAHLPPYPHRQRSVALPSNRGGFRCGHLNAISDTHALWRDADFLISGHPGISPAKRL